jgi:hypothetical protein
MTRSIASGALPWAVALFIACCVVQVFLAGLGVFDDPGAFVTHAGFAYVFGWLTLVILVIALLARAGRWIIGLAVLLLVQFALQSVLVGLRTTMPAVAALHPLNGFAILLVAIAELRAVLALARDTRRRSPMPGTAPGAAPGAGPGAGQPSSVPPASVTEGRTA